MNGDEPVKTTKDENGVETEVPPKTAQALLRRQRERKSKSILLLAIPDEYQLRFHGIQDAKTLWAAIKSRFGGNVESKKMQKNVLKQQFENFSVSDTEGLDKAYDRFQKLISLLEVHGAAVSNEDANQKFLRALPSSWNNVALIMRNKTGIDDLDIDDLYNNLKVFEADIKSSSGSSSNSQNVAFLSAEDTNSINEVNTANGVSTASGHNSQGQASSSSYTDDLMFSFFANQSNSPQLDDEDLEQIDHDDLEEMDLKWQVAMLSMRVKRFYKKTGRKLIFNGKEPVGFDKTKVECFNYHRRGHFAREYRVTRNQGNKNGDERYRSKDNTRRTVPVKTSDALDLTQRFKKGNEYHAVPPPLTGNYIPLLADLSFARLVDSFYRPTANKTSASVSQVETSNTPPSNTSVEMPRVESVRPSGVIIEYWASDDDEDIYQSNEVQTTVKPSFKKIEFTKARNEPGIHNKLKVQRKVLTWMSRHMIGTKPYLLTTRFDGGFVGLWSVLQRLFEKTILGLSEGKANKASSHNKTPYELIIGRAPNISFMRPFGCPVTILNTLDPLGKFDGKAEEGFLVSVVAELIQQHEPLLFSSPIPTTRLHSIHDPKAQILGTKLQYKPGA
ncbi:hypothetical protein Tco_0393349 [Tanacetum coccineum]